MGGSSNRPSKSAHIDVAVWEEFLRAKSRATARNYRDAVSMFLAACGFRDLSEAAAKAEEKHLTIFIRTLKDRGLSPMAIRLYYHGVKSFLTLFDRPVNWSRVANLLPRKRGIRLGEAVPREVVEGALGRIANPIKHLAVWLIWSTGLRIGECLSLRGRDFDFSTNPPKVVVITEKTGEPREIPLPADVAEALKRHCLKLRPEDFVFHPLNNPMRPLSPEKLRIAFRSALMKFGRLERDRSGRGWRYTIHGLRRSYESNLVRAGVSPMVVAVLLGHRLGVEQHYLRLSYEDLVKEWRKAEPLLTLRQALPTDIEERLRAVEESLKLYEQFFDMISKRYPSIMRELGLE
ncbi:MAG: site-specific integrase [Nitrososphaerota archaeon]